MSIYIYKSIFLDKYTHKSIVQCTIKSSLVHKFIMFGLGSFNSQV